MHAKPVRRCDITPLRPVERLADGRVKCDAHFGRAGIQVYHNPDGSERREIRPEAEVFKPASMRSFAMVPFTDDHPHDLLTAATAGPYVKGSTGDTITRDDDHLRGNIGVFDAATIAKMEAGKREVSCGYTCDLIETPGVHPVWGKYDAIQTNIIGNHLALVDKGRAGSAAIRMDAAYAVFDDAAPRLHDDDGTALALLRAHGTVGAMATRRDVTAPTPDPDPNDLANRNAANPNREDEPDDDTECYDSSLYDADGNVSESGAARMAASSWAMPGKKRLPIHDAKAVKDSMKRFGEHEFDSADEKHAAFNRIAGRAAQFGIGTTKFARQHASKLDRKDNEDMIDAQTKLKADKADKRKEQRDEARKRADGLATELATAQGQVASLTADLAAEKAKTGARTDAAQAEFDTKVDEKVALVVKATTILGVGKVDSKTSPTDIKRAVIKHVDKTDVTDTRPGYIDALFDGAVARATADAAATVAGAAALATARGAIAPVLPTTGSPAPTPHADAEDDDEAAAARRMRDRSANAINQSSRMTKDSVMAQINGSK